VPLVPSASGGTERSKLPANWLAAWHAGLIHDAEVLDLLRERANRINLTEVIELLACLDVADIAEFDSPT
jgi:hypothetical protein